MQKQQTPDSCHAAKGPVLSTFYTPFTATNSSTLCKEWSSDNEIQSSICALAMDVLVHREVAMPVFCLKD